MTRPGALIYLSTLPCVVPFENETTDIQIRVDIMNVNSHSHWLALLFVPGRIIVELEKVP